MNVPLLEARALSRRYFVRTGVLRHAPLQALSDVGFTLDEGKTLAIVGESGSGKSTLARLLLMLERPQQGTLIYRGRRLDWQADAYRMQRIVRMIFQNPYESLDPRRRIRDLLAEPLIHYTDLDTGQRNKRIDMMLANVGLDPSQGARFPHMLSGGQRQRVAIARALITGAEIIVADEAVSALDVSVQAQVLNLLLDIQEQQGLSYIFISHDIAVVEVMADEVLVLYLGHVMEYGSAINVLSRPSHPYTRSLLASTPRLGWDGNADKDLLTGDMPSALDPPTGCVFHSRCPYADGRCRRERPALIESDGRRVACHYPGKMASRPMNGIESR